MRISNNNLSGNLPESIANLEVLRVMALSDNFIGPELPNFVSLSNLREYYVNRLIIVLYVSVLTLSIQACLTSAQLLSLLFHQ